MKFGIPGKNKVKINIQHIKFLLTLVVIFLVGFLGVITGFFVIIKPELTATTSTTSTTTTITTTTVETTTSTTTPATTTTIVGTPCNPCFEYFNYVGHNENFLSVRNGPRTVKITKVSQTKGGSIIADFNVDNVNPNQLMILRSDYSTGTEVKIEYIDITSGDARLDSATLH